MFKSTLKRTLKTVVPLMPPLLVCAILLYSEYNFNLSPWISRPLCFLIVLSFLAFNFIALATARLRTSEVLKGTDQILDEEITVKSNSGILVLTDLATLRAWKPTDKYGQDAQERVASDVILKGKRSWAIAKKMGLPGPYLYDVPQIALPAVVKAFTEDSSMHTSKVKVEVESKRVPHKERAERALVKGPGFFNLRDREILAFESEKVNVARSWFVDGSLNSFNISFSEAEPVSYELLGQMTLHSNVITLSDPQALEDWDSLTPRDNLYELLISAKASSAPFITDGEQVDDNIWKWSNVTQEDAQRIGSIFASEDPEAEGALKPHGDEYFLSEQLSFDTSGVRKFSSGSVHAIGIPPTPEAVVSVGFDKNKKPVLLKLSFNVKSEEVFFLPGVTKLEKVVTPFAKRLHARKNKNVKKES